MKKFAAAILALFMTLSLCACGDGGKKAWETPPAPEEDTGIVGVYCMTAFPWFGISSLADMRGAGMTAYLYVQEEGTATLEMFGQNNSSLSLVWDEQAFTFSNLFGDEIDPYTYNDGVISMRMSDGSEYMEFTKLTRIPDNGIVRDCPIKIRGVEQFEEGGEHYLRFYYDVTNNGQEPADPILYQNAYQDGAYLHSVTSPWSLEYNVPEDKNHLDSIPPHKTHTETVVFTFNPEGGLIAFWVSNSTDEEVVAYYRDPQSIYNASASN